MPHETKKVYCKKHKNDFQKLLHNKRLIIVAVISILIGFLFSFSWQYHATEKKIYDALYTGIDTCEDDDQVLRVYHDTSKNVRFECFGTLPDIQLHTYLEE